MFGVPVIIAVLGIAFCVLVVTVAAGVVLSWFVRKQEPITVVPTQPHPVLASTWLSKEAKEQLAAMTTEEVAALYATEEPNTPGRPESRPFPFLAATIGDVICAIRVRAAEVRIMLAAILAAPLVAGVTDLLTSPAKTERLLRRRFIAATVGGGPDTPLLTEHPAETARLAAPVVWHLLASDPHRQPALVNQAPASKDEEGTQLRGAVAREGIANAHGADAGRRLVLAMPHTGS